MSNSRPLVAIVDFGMGNHFSVSSACEHVGLDSVITHDPALLRSAEAVILPGVGAFGKAMEALRDTGMDDALREAAAADKPFFGICLGLQLLFSESAEFGRQSGLGIVPGKVVRLLEGAGADAVRVPHVGWNRIRRSQGSRSPEPRRWHDGILDGFPDGEFMYFVHSFHAAPESGDLVATSTEYGANRFCSSIRCRNIFACQFHPERSGPSGLRFYRALAEHLRVRPAPLRS